MDNQQVILLYRYGTSETFLEAPLKKLKDEDIVRLYLKN
jgi:hypothetical protein